MKKKLIILLCVLLGLSWYTAISETINNPKKMAAHLEAAASYEAQGIYVDAVTEYEQALTYRPDDVEISLKMANAYLQMGNSSKFESICQNYAEGNQKDTTAMDCLMNYYSENEYSVDAVKYLNDFLADYPENENAQKWMLKFKGSFTYLYGEYSEKPKIANDNMIFEKNEKYGVSDRKGKKILEPIYEEMYPFSKDGYALVKTEGVYSYIDIDGQRRLLAEKDYTDLGMLQNKRTVAALNGKFAYLDENLKPVTEFAWDALTLIEEGMGAGQKNGKWAIINKKGEAQTEYIYEDVSVDEYGFCSIKQRIFVKEQGSYKMLNKKLENVGDLKFDAARPFGDGSYAAVCMNGKWGFVNEDGELVIECVYDDAQSFSNGFAAVCVGGKWGYIDESGYMAIEPQFIDAMGVSKEGVAAVLNETWQLIQLSVFL